MLEFIYLDTREVPSTIRHIMNVAHFGDVRYQKHSLREHIETSLAGLNVRFHHLRDKAAVNAVLAAMAGSGAREEKAGDERVILYDSSVGAVRFDALALFFKKLALVSDPLRIRKQGRFLPVIACQRQLALDFLRQYAERQCWDYSPSGRENFVDLEREDYLEDISNYENFIGFIKASHETRFFNALSEEGFFLRKSSRDKQKMAREFKYYYFLPDEFKVHFVPPLKYTDHGEHASYLVEKLNIPDAALLWLNNSFSLDEWRIFVDRLFMLLCHRPEQAVAKDEFLKRVNGLYLEKVRQRFAQLKALKVGAQMERLLASGLIAGFGSFEEIFATFRSLYEEVFLPKVLKDKQLVVSHGDFCLSNILYDKRSQLLKLIDPRGALVAEDIYLDRYYDLAKLSHSVLGAYDFINQGNFKILVDRSLTLRLEMPQNHLEPAAGEYFRRKLTECFGDCEALVRLGEASLFLSMLPLHTEDDKKVLGFLLQGTALLRQLASP